MDYLTEVNILFNELRYDDAIELSNRMIDLGESLIAAHTHLGILYRYKGEYDKALFHYNKAVSLGTREPKVFWNLALLQLLKGDFVNGFYNYEAGLASGHRVQQYVDTPMWTGQPLDGKSLVIYNEQGLGDTLNFSRAVNFLKQKYPSAKISFEVQPELEPLYARSDLKLTEYDYAIPLVSIFKHEPEAMKEKYDFDIGSSQSFYPPTRIGVCWKGNPKQSNDVNRSPQVKVVEPLFTKDFEFVSLVQNTNDAEKKLIEKYGINAPINPGSSIIETVEVIKNLDLVITSDTMIAHLASSLRKPTWIMLSTICDWRWGLNTDKSYWYSSARLFRQPSRGDWESVIKNIENELILK